MMKYYGMIAMLSVLILITIVANVRLVKTGDYDFVALNEPFSSESIVVEPAIEESREATLQQNTDTSLVLCVADPVPGDVNSDGKVGNADIAVVSSNLGVKGRDVAGDANGDKVVDSKDFTIVTENFGTQRCPQTLESGS